jgi:pimeloyl-ACP methyl ester carboxylesterase
LYYDGEDAKGRVAVCLAFGVLLLVTGAAPGALTPATRAGIDRAARELPPGPPAREAAYLAGDLATWLLSRATLTPAEERDAAAALHEQVLARYRPVPAPEAAGRVFGRLLDTLPPHLKPDAFAYTLTILDAPTAEAFTTGGGFVYLTRPLFDTLPSGARGEAALAFVLAAELGHVGLEHARRGWQLAAIEAEIDRGLLPRVRREALREALGTTVDRTGRLVRFLYTPVQQFEADTLALHLCTAAGFPAERCLDAVRVLALEEGRPAALVRLRHLLLECDGAVEDEDRYGLFLYDPRDSSLSKCAARSVPAGARPLVLVHGLHGGTRTFRAWLPFLAGREELAGRPLLVFRYPNSESLARCGSFLSREVGRVFTAPSEAVFIAHSAGGLVVRDYAEVHKGKLDRAVFLGTPHAGSNLTSLAFLAELASFAGGLRGGLKSALEDLALDGRGAVVQDLHPDSLFLRRLGPGPELAARYAVFTGRFLTRSEALALRSALAAGRHFLGEQAADSISSLLLRTQVLRALDRCRLPPEITAGDGVVSVASATLPGAGRVTHTRLHHRAFTTDAGLMRRVVEAVAER